MFIFQEAFFRTIYTTRTIKQVKEEITILHEQQEFDDITIEELLFSQKTQTVTKLIPKNTLLNDNNTFDLLIIEVYDYDTETSYNLYAPKKDTNIYYEGDYIEVTGFYNNSDIVYPLVMTIDGSIIIESKAKENSKNEEINIDYSDTISFEGTIISIKNNSIEDELKVSNISSNEILNYLTMNYMTRVDFDNGFYYFTSPASGESSNLVFISEIELENSPYLLISVYEMDHIEDIVRTAATVNIYMFIVVLIILIIASFIYSREFSRPLLYISKQTQKMSVLDFSGEPLKIDSTDEFSVLARNINILSFNLNSTLHQLNEQNKQLSKSLEIENQNEERRNEFIRGMSHELKTPLAVIQASAEALQNEIYTEPQEISDALSLIQKEVARTNKMIREMSQVYASDTISNNDNWETVNLKDIIKDIDQLLYPLYNNLNLEVNYELDDAPLYCLKNKIETVIINLFNNAIKYTPKGNKIEIILQNNKDDVTFSITNYGVSLSENDTKKIFEPFYRVDKVRSRVEGSTGLGLYIVSQALEIHSSKCVAYNVDNGITFEFKIKNTDL